MLPWQPAYADLVVFTKVRKLRVEDYLAIMEVEALMENEYTSLYCLQSIRRGIHQ